MGSARRKPEEKEGKEGIKKRGGWRDGNGGKKEEKEEKELEESNEKTDKENEV